MGGYKFSANWLPFRTHKPADDRHSGQQVERPTFNLAFLTPSFPSCSSFSQFSVFLAFVFLLRLHHTRKHIPVVRFAAALSLPPPCVPTRSRWYRSDTGPFTGRHLTLSRCSHTRINTGIPPSIPPSSHMIPLSSFTPFPTFPPFFFLAKFSSFVFSFAVTFLPMIIHFLVVSCVLSLLLPSLLFLPLPSSLSPHSPSFFTYFLVFIPSLSSFITFILLHSLHLLSFPPSFPSQFISFLFPVPLPFPPCFSFLFPSLALSCFPVSSLSFLFPFYLIHFPLIVSPFFHSLSPFPWPD